MSNDLEWLLIRKYNSFMVKRSPEGPIFSKEAGNLPNLHSHKYSGLANAKTIDIRQGPSGAVHIVTKKPKSSTQAVNAGRSVTTIRNRSGTRRSLGATAKTFKGYYRPDLRHVAIARVAALSVSQKEKKPAPPPKAPRGKKANKAKAVAAAADAE